MDLYRFVLTFSVSIWFAMFTWCLMGSSVLMSIFSMVLGLHGVWAEFSGGQFGTDVLSMLATDRLCFVCQLWCDGCH